MRSTVLYPAALTALAALGVGMALRSSLVDLSGPAPVRSSPAMVQSAPTPWTSEVVFVDRGSFQRAQKQKGFAPNTLVLDLAGLESLDAALTLVNTRAEVRAAAGALVCWVSAASRAEAAAAADALGREGCTKVYASP